MSRVSTDIARERVKVAADVARAKAHIAAVHAHHEIHRSVADYLRFWIVELILLAVLRIDTVEVVHHVGRSVAGVLPW